MSVLSTLRVLGPLRLKMHDAARTGTAGVADGTLRLYNDGTDSFIQEFSRATGAWSTYKPNSITGQRNLPIPASAFLSPSTNGAADGTTHGTNHSYATKDFDTTTEEHIDYDFTMPSTYAGGNITVEFSWTAASGSGTVSWELNVASGADSAVLDAAKTDVGSATDTLITAGDIHKISMTWSTSLPTAGDLVTLRVSRDVAADTLGVDALLKEVSLSWSV